MSVSWAVLSTQQGAAWGRGHRGAPPQSCRRRKGRRTSARGEQRGEETSEGAHHPSSSSPICYLLRPGCRAPTLPATGRYLRGHARAGDICSVALNFESPPTALSLARLFFMRGFVMLTLYLCPPPVCLLVLFSMPGDWVLLLGSRSPFRRYHRHRAP